MKAPELVQLTRDLIQILQPQRVLCLGGANCLYQLFPKYETTLEALIPRRALVYEDRLYSCLRHTPYEQLLYQ